MGKRAKTTLQYRPRLRWTKARAAKVEETLDNAIKRRPQDELLYTLRAYIAYLKHPTRQPRAPASTVAGYVREKMEREDLSNTDAVKAAAGHFNLGVRRIRSLLKEVKARTVPLP